MLLYNNNIDIKLNILQCLLLSYIIYIGDYMKLQIVKQELLRVLQFAHEASEKENINSYYSFFIFEAKYNCITVKSANRQTTFEENIHTSELTKLNVTEEGEFLIPGTMLLNMVSALNDGLILMESEDFNLKIIEDTSKKSNIEFNIRLRDIKDYPKEIHSLENNNACSINILDITKIIKNTAFAVSSNLKDTSMFLTGIFFDIEDNILTAVATDRNRISICKVIIEGIYKLKESVQSDIIIPQKSILFLKKIISKNEEILQIEMSIDNEKILFKIGNIKISSNLISGKYYDYRRIIPEGQRNKVTLNTQRLKNTINRVIVASDNRRENNVLVIIENNTVIISAEEKEKSKAKETLEGVVEGEHSNFLIKSQFILDPLNIIDSENVVIEYGDSVRDLIKITSTNADEETLHIAAQINQ